MSLYLILSHFSLLYLPPLGFQLSAITEKGTPTVGNGLFSQGEKEKIVLSSVMTEFQMSVLVAS